MNKSIRSGSWQNVNASCRAAYRGDDDPGFRSSVVSFRVVVEIDRQKTFRGGSLWSDALIGCRSACRDYDDPVAQNDDLGFRVVKEG